MRSGDVSGASSSASIRSMLDFSGREALVTGGTGALGTAVVGRLLAAGATVHVPVYIPEELEGFSHRDHDAVRIHEGLDLALESDVARLYGAINSLMRAFTWREDSRWAPSTRRASKPGIT